MGVVTGVVTGALCFHPFPTPEMREIAQERLPQIHRVFFYPPLNPPQPTGTTQHASARTHRTWSIPGLKPAPRRDSSKIRMHI